MTGLIISMILVTALVVALIAMLVTTYHKVNELLIDVDTSDNIIATLNEANNKWKSSYFKIRIWANIDGLNIDTKQWGVCRRAWVDGNSYVTRIKLFETDDENYNRICAEELVELLNAKPE